MTHKESTDILELFVQKPLVKICAPMVRYSKLQFRNLVKGYNCDLVFTPMILADSFCKSSKARDNEFSTNLLDTPLITQFAANTVHDFVGASYLVAPFCDGVDLNCGCPQRWAREQNLGCELCKSPQKIFELIRECRNRIPKPFTVSVKTRIQKDDRETVNLCQTLERSGLSFLTIHARTVDNNVGPINEVSLKLISDSIQIPVVGNGGVSTLEACWQLQKQTGINGVMVANGILTNPEIFTGAKVTSKKCVQEWLNICFNSTLSTEMFNNITTCRTIPEKPANLTFQCFHHHLVFMLEKVLTRKQRHVFNNLKSFKSVLNFLDENLQVRPQLYNSQQFSKSAQLILDYKDRSILYDELRPLIEIKNSDFLDYDYVQSDGRYFNQKLEDESSDDCEWLSMFLEND